MTELAIGLILGLAALHAGPGQQSGPPQRISGGNVKPGKLIVAPKPEIPRLAVLARVHGWVRMEAVIDRDGSIASLRVLSGHPFLIPAAMEAAKQYRYEPAMFAGAPLSIETIIEIEFKTESPPVGPVPMR